MVLKELRISVCQANLDLKASGLVLSTFGNVSGVDRQRKMMVIKPSGLPYTSLIPENMVCVSLETGQTVDSDLNPSSDTATHLEIYRAFSTSGGVVHTHSEFATSCAQARIPIRCMGTTHADYFFGDIPVTRELSAEETIENYEKNTGLVIIETFRTLNPVEIPAVLVANHGPFVWGRNPQDAVHNAVIAEFLAKMEVHTKGLNPAAPRPPQYLVDKHYRRKHGADAYYGQKNDLKH
jgi:L-ribulose-5-phosphate 4-epimerase